MFPQSRYIPISTPLGDHEIHITEWGDPHNPPLIMWHGLSRTGRDFDTAARHFAERYRVICPDTIGRGLSTWSKAPEKEYNNLVYVGHAALLLAALGIERCAWIGTSMGGLIGMGVTVGPMAGRITHLVLNDVGPEIDQISLTRIRDYLRHQVVYATMSEFEDHIRAVHASFGSHTAAEWRHMAETSVRRQDDGSFTTHYDPNIIRVFGEAIAADPVLLWEYYDKITAPTLVLRGQRSDVLTPRVAHQMTERGPKAQLAVIEGCGHAPAINTLDQIAVVDRFLRS